MISFETIAISLYSCKIPRKTLLNFKGVSNTVYNAAAAAAQKNILTIDKNI